MRKLRRALVVGLTVIAAVVAVPAAASATDLDPPAGTPTKWLTYLEGFCLGVAGADMRPGTEIIIWSCNGSPDQTWIAVPSGQGDDFILRNGMDRNKCLSVANNSLRANAQLIIWDCKDSLGNRDQRWKIEFPARGPRVNFFTNVNSSMLMGVKDGNIWQGQKVVQTADLRFLNLWGGVAA